MMKDQDKTKDQLVSELAEMRRRVAELEAETGQVRAKEGLQDRLALLRSIINNSPDTVYSLDLATHKATFLNREAFCGYSRRELEAPGSLLEAIHPDDAEALAAHWRRLVESSGTPRDPIEATTEMEIAYRLRRKDGGWEWVQSRETVLSHNSDGTAAQLLVTLTLITGRKQAEEALRESEEKYRALAESYPNGIFISDRERFIYVNQRLCEITGFSSKELLNMPDPVGSLFAPEERERVLAYAQSRLQGDTVPTSYRVRGVRRDGKEILLKFAVSSIVLAGKRVLQGVVKDVTERVQMEKALRESQELFALFMDKLPHGVFIKDKDHKVLYVNQYMKERYNAQNWLGKNAYSAFPKEFAKAMHADDRQALLEGQTTVEEVVLDKDGIERVSRTTKFRIDRASEPPLLGGIGLDITERKRMEKALRESEERYRRLVENTDDLVYRYEFMPQRGFAYVSPSATEMTGYTPEEHYADPELGFKLVHPQDRHLLESLSQEEDQIRKPIVLRWLKKDGSLVWTEQKNVPVYDDEGNLVALEGIARDITERKRAEAEIQRLASFPQLNANPVLEVDRSGAVTFCNQATIAILEKLGLPPDARAFMPPDITDILQELARGEQSKFRREVRLNGAVFGEDIHLAPQFDAVRIYARDITERKQAEDELAKTQALLLAAIEQTPAGILIADAPDVNIRIANSAALGIRGEVIEPLTDIPVELHPQHWQTFRPDGTPFKPKELPLSRAILEGRISRNIDAIIRRQDGEERWISANAAPVRNQEGEIIAGVVVFPDVTERKQAEEALRESEKRYRLLFNRGNDAIFVHQLTAEGMPGQFIEVNDVACQRLGYTREELLALSPSDIDAPESLGDVPGIMERLLAEKHTLFETVHVAKDGTRTPVEINTHLFDLEEKPTFLSIARDITERKQAEKALRQYTTELEASNEELDAYAHTVAHDLKAPLALIIGFAEVLEEEHVSLSDEQLHRYLYMMAQNGRKMKNIIDELLLLASVRKMDEVPLKPLDMASVVARAQESLAHMVEEYRPEVILPDAWPKVQGYGPWVEEVWANYLSNAIKYGGQPPRVELGFETLDGDHGPVRFWVRDNGPGLTPEEQGRLFRPFERLDQMRAKGHGLGLSIVRRIVEKLGGRVGVKSITGQGSEFYFTLPATPNFLDEPVF